MLLIGNFQGAHRPKPGRTAFSLFFFQLNEIQLMEDLISPSGLQGKRHSSAPENEFLALQFPDQGEESLDALI